MIWGIIKGLFSIFINPLLYLYILVALLFGYQRVRRERLSFGVKVYGIVDHMGKAVIPSLIVGLIGSVLLLVAGVAVPFGFIALITVCYLLLFATGQVRYMTASYAVGLAIFIAAILPNMKDAPSFLKTFFYDIHQVPLASKGILLIVVLVLEGILIAIWGGFQTSPRLINSKRGRKVGAHEANQIWLAPLFLLIPMSGGIPRVDWWPLTYTGLEHFSLVLIPFGMTLQQFISHTLPEKAVAGSSRWIFYTAILGTVLVAFGIWFNTQLLVVISACLVILSRMGLVVYQHYQFSSKPFYLLERRDGLTIVGVIPYSPADKMGLQIGETIRKVNDKKVNTENEFYEALQMNATYCKLDVLDYDNEVRFVTSPIYEDDYHKIGLLFLEPSRRAPQHEAK